MKELGIGQLWWDKNHEWCDGSDDLDVCYLILSADMQELEGKNVMVYKCAFFMWASGSYCGAHIREYTEEEIKLMEYAGNISDIKSFK